MALPDDDFGLCVSLSGDTVIVGAPESDLPGTGSAHVFVRDMGVWSHQKELTATDAAIPAERIKATLPTIAPAGRTTYD